MRQPSSSTAITIIPVAFAGEIRPGDDLVEKLSIALRHQNARLRDDDILVIKHKIVSKAEGQIVRLETIRPSRAARQWARQSGSDAGLIQLALDESRRVVRKKVVAGRGVLIAETRHGFICANSGVDVSNVDGGQHALLLPKEPDRSAARLRADVKRKLGIRVAVIISDSFGRPWREGLVEVAIGVAGMKPLRDDRRSRDPHGYKLRASVEAVADEIACAAGLACGKLNRTPVCILRGVSYEKGPGMAQELIRSRKNDLFR